MESNPVIVEAMEDLTSFSLLRRNVNFSAQYNATLHTKPFTSLFERIPNLTGEQSDGITVFRIPPMTSLMLHQCRTGAINLQRWWQSPSAAISESDWFLYRAGISRRMTSCTVVSWRFFDSRLDEKLFNRIITALPIFILCLISSRVSFIFVT
ncbi:hypothetical protein ANN_04156 [Periplaneta americana]|uniref:Uncharacterized protein n=1 Tax=Periplaneta americana TaxID=6978 RepID=A0ABQ8T7T6_PERAM|nr:hypothetical protein ANN_04156 [Periplaneta americana]